jgi:hypothetical protein
MNKKFQLTVPTDPRIIPQFVRDLGVEKRHTFRANGDGTIIAFGQTLKPIESSAPILKYGNFVDVWGDRGGLVWGAIAPS